MKPWRASAMAVVERSRRADEDEEEDFGRLDDFEEDDEFKDEDFEEDEFEDEDVEDEDYEDYDDFDEEFDDEGAPRRGGRPRREWE